MMANIHIFTIFFSQKEMNSLYTFHPRPFNYPRTFMGKNSISNISKCIGVTLLGCILLLKWDCFEWKLLRRVITICMQSTNDVETA